MLKYLSAFALGSVAGSFTWKQLERGAAPDRGPRSPSSFSRMQHDALIDALHRLRDERDSRYASVDSPAGLAEFQRDLRTRIEQCFDVARAARPPRIEVRRSEERGAYRVDDLCFDSRSGLRISADLYVPHASERRPAVLVTCGHADEGRRYQPYRALARGLAEAGFVVLIYDPVGQGDRVQFPSEDGRSRFGPPAFEHLVLEKPLTLLGESFASWRVLDAMSGLDLLAEHESVDPGCIGVAGHSGGGTVATWMTALDPRITMVGASGFVGSFVTNAENEFNIDPEQAPPGALAVGLDHEDFLTVFAPRRAVLLATREDFFDVRATRQVHGRLARIYSLLAAPGRVSLHVDEGPHRLSALNREVLVEAFTAEADAPFTPAGGAPPPDVDVADIRDPVDGPTMPGLIAESARTFAARRGALSPSITRRRLANVAGISAPGSFLNYRVLRSPASTGYPRPTVERYAIESEPGMFVVARVLPGTGGSEATRPALLYVAHHSADEELRSRAWVRDLVLADPARTVIAIDVRGIGESRPAIGEDLPFDAEFGGDDFFAFYGALMADPVIVQRTRDVLAAIDWVVSARGMTRIEVAAAGWGAIPASFACLLDERVVGTRLHRCLESYGSVAESPETVWPLSTMLPDVLRHFDLPDIRVALGERMLEFSDPCGPLDRP